MTWDMLGTGDCYGEGNGEGGAGARKLRGIEKVGRIT